MNFVLEISTMKSNLYQQKIIVQAEHIDGLNHVNNVVYLQWAQDLAGKHWLSRSTEEINNKFYWVVLDHFVEYKAEAFLDDTLLAKTFVEQNKGARSTRIVEFYKEEKLIVSVKTTWCLIDRKRKRATRIPEAINLLFFDE